MNLFLKLSQFFLYIFLVAFPFGQLTRIRLPLLPVEVRVYLTDVSLILLLVSWLLWHLSAKIRIRFSSLIGPILAFFAVGFLSLLANISRLSIKETLVSSLYLIRWLVYAGLYLSIFDLNHQVKMKSFLTHRLKLYLMVLSVTVAFFGLVQYLLWPDLRTFEAANWDPHYYRVVSTFLDPGFTGLILVFGLILIISFFAQASFVNKKKILIFAAVIIYLSFALTYSRTSYLAYLVAAGIIAWKKRSFRFFGLAFIILLLTIVILPRPGGEGVRLERWASIEARIKNWQQATEIFLDHPLLGVGFNAYRYAARDYGFLGHDWQENHAGAGSDSSLLLVLATTGLPGLVTYLWLWLGIFNLIRRKEKNKPGQFGLFILATLAALGVHSFFLNSLFYAWIMAWYWMMIVILEIE
ncbi:MAG TPA: O-antigen ligase family protein [Candidatus Bathyarchaeia archaeon]|nr:O-antigen ligase family protein [Candidatus Bathyarchaeia archaeon]